MRRIYLTLLMCLTAMVFTDCALAAISATIDRNQIALDETLNLSIVKEDGASFSSPDLTPLEKDFRIVGHNQSSNARFINGSVSSSITLDLSLAPKRSGLLEIPPLSIGNEMTEALQVKVVTQAQPKTKADNTPLFIETELDNDTVPVQAQLILTLRIYWAVEASINEPADPQVNDALLQRLDDATYNKTINGRNYKVFERKYAIFPQKSGELLIPQLIVQATVPDRRRRGSLNDFFGAGGRVVKLRSETKKVTVLEKPPEYPTGAVWLPTDRLTIAEEWSDEPDQLQVGESATVTIALAGSGLLAAQLPPIELPETAGLKLYQGKAEVQDLIKLDGVTGIRKESIAVIPVEAGRKELPEIRIPWWNLQEGRVDYAVIPARQLTIKAAATGGGQAGQAAPPSLNQPKPGGALPAQEIMQESRINRPLLFLSAFLALAWLITISFLIKTRRSLAKLAAGDATESGAQDNTREKEAFRKLVLACRANDPIRARKALVDWARATPNGHGVRSVSDLGKIYPGSGLAVIIEDLDRILYGRADQPTEWHGKELLEELEAIRKTGAAKPRRKPSLPQLYK
ncbi:MAG: BatD family protein [Desulfurivibrionaceae bacterium]